MFSLHHHTGAGEPSDSLQKCLPGRETQAVLRFLGAELAGGGKLLTTTNKSCAQALLASLQSFLQGLCRKKKSLCTETHKTNLISPQA